MTAFLKKVKFRMDKTSKPTVVDLFSGAGGLSAGFSNAGFRIVGAVESWAPAAASIKANHPEAYVETGDIRKIDPVEFGKNLKSAPNVILGGPSCQGFSTSGGLSRMSGRNIDDERNSLFLDFVRFVDALRPEWVVMENVPGLLMFNRGIVAEEIIKQFRVAGYHVAPMILLAADFGVPQLRRRLFFIGHRLQQSIAFPAPTHGNDELWKNFALPFAHLSKIGNKTEAKQLLDHVSFEEACGDLPSIELGGKIEEKHFYLSPPQSQYQGLMRNRSRKVSLHCASNLSEFVKAAMLHINCGENWTKLPANLKTGRYLKIRPYDATTLLRRLVAHKPAYTINTKFNDATTGAYIHPKQNRTLSLREGARIQSFPDAYIFEGSSGDIRKQIGNAVPPLLSQKIAEAIRAAYFEEINGSINESSLDSIIEIDPYAKPNELIGLKPKSSNNDAVDARQLDMLLAPDTHNELQGS